MYILSCLQAVVYKTGLKCGWIFLVTKEHELSGNRSHPWVDLKNFYADLKRILWCHFKIQHGTEKACHKFEQPMIVDF